MWNGVFLYKFILKEHRLKFTKLELDHILKFRQLIFQTSDFTTTFTSGLKSPGEGGITFAYAFVLNNIIKNRPRIESLHGIDE